MCVCEREREREKNGSEEDGERQKELFPGSTILTICESLEAHLAAVFAKASHGSRPHLYHVHCTRPEALHASCVSLAPLNGGVNLCMVLKGATDMASG